MDVIQMGVSQEDMANTGHLVETQTGYATPRIDEDIPVDEKRSSPVASTDASTATQNPQLHTTHAPIGSADALVCVLCLQRYGANSALFQQRVFCNTLLRHLSQNGPTPR
jgi:hypothetical protein